jgi:HlyD family secretion protein
MRERRSYRVWLYAGLSLAAIVTIFLLSARRPVPRVEVVTVARGNLSAAIPTNGKVEPVEPFEMRALIPSHVVRTYAIEGQAVKKGQLLIELDNAQIRAEVAHAQEGLVAQKDALRIANSGGSATQLAQIDSDIRKADLDHTRLQENVTALEKLVAQQAATQQELTVARANLARSEADQRRLQTEKAEFVRQAKLDVDRQSLLVQQAQDNLRDLEEKARSTRITAPVDGTLYAFPLRENDTAKPGDLLAAVADLRRIRVRAFIDEPDLGKLVPGQSVEITWDALPNRKWAGTTQQIPRQVVPHGTRSVGELLCTVNNDDQRLIPNTNVSVRIELDQRKSVVLVPRGALVFDKAQRFVFVVQDATENAVLRKQEVQLGISDATNFEVVSGLNTGEVIALPTNIEPKDGMRVRVIRPE